MDVIARVYQPDMRRTRPTRSFRSASPFRKQTVMDMSPRRVFERAAENTEGRVVGWYRRPPHTPRPYGDALLPRRRRGSGSRPWRIRGAGAHGHLA